MKKIVFNDKFGLTKAVLECRKTQTRRIITYPKTFHGKDVCGFYVYKRATDGVITEVCMYDENEISIDEGQILPKYMVGEVIAVAQRYKDVIPEIDWVSRKLYEGTPKWNNKMFVCADLMPNRIRITDVHVERLQDISDEDCLKEGIYAYYYGDEKEKRFYEIPPDGYSFDGIDCHYPTPREAFANLIDKVSGKGTWDSNPWVWVYDFELV